MSNENPSRSEEPGDNGATAGAPPGRRRFTSQLLRAAIAVVVLLLILNWMTYPSSYIRQKEEARRDLTRIEAAVRQYDSDHGRFPASLDALVAAGGYLESVPTDPFATDGEPYGYLYYGDGDIVRVYSVDFDGEDHKTYADRVIFIHPPRGARRSANDYFYEYLQIAETADDSDNNMTDYMSAHIALGANRLDPDTPVEDLKRLEEEGLEVLRETDPGAVAAVRDWIRSESEALELVRRGATKPITKAVPAWLGTFRFTDAKYLSRLLTMRAHFHRLEGDLDAALDDYLAVLEYGKDLAGSHRMMGFMLEDTAAFLSFRGLEEALLEGLLTPEQLVRIQEAVKAWEKERTTLAEAFIREQDVVELYFEDRRRGQERVRRGQGMWNRLTAWLLKPWYDRQAAQEQEASEELWAEIHQNLQEPYEEALRLDQGQLQEESQLDDSLVPPHAMTLFVRERRIQTYASAIRILAGLELYRQQEGKFPERLADLEPLLQSVPDDSFNARPFNYEGTPQGFRLSSDGPDLTSQSRGAVYDPTNGTVSSGDIIFGGP